MGGRRGGADAGVVAIRPVSRVAGVIVVFRAPSTKTLARDRMTMSCSQYKMRVLMLVARAATAFFTSCETS